MDVEMNAANSSLNDLRIDTSTLEKNVELFPYSTYARYLLLERYKKNGHHDFEKNAKKTAVYFNNAQWLQFQLSQLENGVGNGSNDSYSGANHFAVLTGQQIENTSNSESDVDQTVDGFIPVTETEEAIVYDSPKNSAGETIQSRFDIETNNEQIISTGESLVKVDATDEQMADVNASENINEEDFTANGYLAETISDGSFKEEQAHLLEGNDESIVGSNAQPTTTEITEQGDHPNAEEHNQEETILNTGESAVLPGTATIANASTDEDVLAFEPLHTVDYFASQGIKITDEVFTNDKLGTQMKSFTEWLRSMKKLQTGNLPQQNSLAEHIIQSAAETSNIDTEVLTEAMAEVLIKQNKREKAIEMYNKLSLINPAKSAYFAAKIESIKTT